MVLAVAVGVAVDPAALAGARSTPAAAAGVAVTGHVTRVSVTAADMRFTPATVRVPAGDRLVIDLRNTDDADVHDLVLDSGQDSGRLAPGESTTVDVGVVGRNIEGWCSVVGHRQMGMVFHVHVTGAKAGADHAGPAGVRDGSGTASADAGSAADRLDFAQDPGPSFRARDASLPPVAAGRVHRRTFTVSEVEREVAPGVRQRLWTYNGKAPGPVLHGRVGDRFVIRLVNDATMGHSVDFHAGTLAPDLPMRTIAPGKSLTYRFTADRAGIWLYHCASMPMSAHIANGMFGAVVIDPPDLPKVDRSYVLLQSELYLGPQGGSVDEDKVKAERPDAVVFNGYANQYDHRPLAAKVGRAGADLGARRRSEPAHVLPRGRRAVRHGVLRGRLPVAPAQPRARRGAGALPGAGAGRLRGADLPAAGPLPVHLPRHGRCRAWSPRDLPGHPLDAARPAAGCSGSGSWTIAGRARVRAQALASCGRGSPPTRCARPSSASASAM